MPPPVTQLVGTLLVEPSRRGKGRDNSLAFVWSKHFFQGRGKAFAPLHLSNSVCGCVGVVRVGPLFAAQRKGKRAAPPTVTVMPRGFTMWFRVSSVLEMFAAT